MRARVGVTEFTRGAITVSVDARGVSAHDGRWAPDPTSAWCALADYDGGRGDEVRSIVLMLQPDQIDGVDAAIAGFTGVTPSTRSRLPPSVPRPPPPPSLRTGSSPEATTALGIFTNIDDLCADLMAMVSPGAPLSLAGVACVESGRDLDDGGFVEVLEQQVEGVGTGLVARLELSWWNERDLHAASIGLQARGPMGSITAYLTPCTEADIAATGVDAAAVARRVRRRLPGWKVGVVERRT